MVQYKIKEQYATSTKFEISVDANGWNFLVIYGKHISGYFCCIPNWNVGCEMAEPSDVFYNRQQLRKTAMLLDDNQKEIEAAAEPIAQAIKEFSEMVEKDPNVLRQTSIFEMIARRQAQTKGILGVLDGNNVGGAGR